MEQTIGKANSKHIDISDRILLNTQCPLCSSNNFHSIQKTKDYRFNFDNSIYNLDKCDECGLIFLNPRPSKETISHYYPDEKFYINNDRLTYYFSRILMEFKKIELHKYKKCGKILDVGCGTGTFLSVFNKKQWDRYGVEISEYASKVAKKNTDKIYTCEINQCHFPDNFFDVIIVNQVLEHLFNPHDELKEIHRILNKDGLLLISVPNIECNQYYLTEKFWLHLDVPRHLIFYSPSTLSLFLEKNGFRVISITKPMFEHPLDIYQSLKRKILMTSSSPTESYIFIKSLPYLILKIFPQWRGTIQVLAKRIE